MARATPFWKQRQIWTFVVGLAALAFWVVGLGAGWRGWTLSPFDKGIVAHAQAFGVEATVWWIPATIITLTAVLMAIGISVVRHLVDGPIATPEKEPLAERAAVPAREPIPQRATIRESPTDDPTAQDPTVEEAVGEGDITGNRPGGPGTGDTGGARPT